MQPRLKLLRSYMAEQELDGLVISKPVNRRYFSGFAGTAGLLLITEKKAQLITDFRYIEQAGKQAKGFEIVRHGKSIYETVNHLIGELHVKRIGFEADHVSFETYELLSKTLASAALAPIKLDQLREQKDSDEIVLIKRAVAIADTAFSHILSLIRAGMSELDVAFELESTMRKLGSERPAFATIVASGARSAMPHGIASDKLLEPGDFVTMDFGAVYQGYHSDMTRTVVIGRATDRQKDLYQTVLSAQLAGLTAVRASRLCREVDAAARDIIAAAGFGEYFGHGLGHCVGLAIHEEPRLSPANEFGVLAENMVVTVEPGVYLPDWGGVRIEDLVVVTADGCDILTASEKQLIEIDR